MPTYAYACTACEHRFEAVQAFTDASLTECPECRGRLRKLFNSVGIVFKGSGFYRTDSRAGAAKSESTASSGSSESKPSSDAGAGSSKSSDSSSGSTGGSSSSTSSSSGSSSAGSGGSSTSTTAKAS